MQRDESDRGQILESLACHAKAVELYPGKGHSGTNKAQE